MNQICKHIPKNINYYGNWALRWIAMKEICRIWLRWKNLSAEIEKLRPDFALWHGRCGDFG